MAINLTPLTPNDLDQVIQHEEILFNQPFTYDEYLFELNQNPFATYIALKQDDKVLGWAGIHCIYEESTLITIGVIKEQQHHGLAKVMLKYLVETAQEQGCLRMILEVDVNNHRAISIYQKAGFKQTRLRKNYYQESDAYEMCLDWSSHEQN